MLWIKVTLRRNLRESSFSQCGDRGKEGWDNFAFSAAVLSLRDLSFSLTETKGYRGVRGELPRRNAEQAWLVGVVLGYHRGIVS